MDPKKFLCIGSLYTINSAPCSTTSHSQSTWFYPERYGIQSLPEITVALRAHRTQCQSTPLSVAPPPRYPAQHQPFSPPGCQPLKSSPQRSSARNAVMPLSSAVPSGPTPSPSSSLSPTVAPSPTAPPLPPPSTAPHVTLATHCSGTHPAAG